MKQACKNCPFRKENEWHYGAEGKIEALKSTDEAGVFSCHILSPGNNVFSVNPMTENTCVGFKMLQENMKEPDTHTGIVNNFNETGPVYDLKAWADHEQYFSKLNLV